MRDLNDLFFYARVVDHGGFAPAARALGIPKSRLSRRIALLEERLGVRLIQRSSRRFAVTEIGQTYHAHCKAMQVEAEAAQEGNQHAVVEMPTGLGESQGARDVDRGDGRHRASSVAERRPPRQHAV